MLCALSCVALLVTKCKFSKMGGSESHHIEELMRLGKRDEVCEKVWAEIIEKEDLENLKSVNIEINNLVFEGGGTKGVAYCGALKLLDELGLLKNVKRFAGTSVGAWYALKLCLGLGIDDVLLTNMLDLSKLAYDSGKCGFLLNVIRKFGWHTGNGLLKALRNDVTVATGNPDTTFYEWYCKSKKELCVPVLNVNTGSIEYCHPKTTPDMPMALAVRASMSIPVIFQPTTAVDGDSIIYFCDGGLLDNYPLHVFDGWYLSMAKEDSFFHKISQVSEPFEGRVDDTTLGMLVFSAEESERADDVYMKRYGDKLTGNRPKTKLAKERKKRFDVLAKKKMDHANIVQACKVFLEKLAEYDLDKSGNISKDEFKETLDKMYSDAESREHLKNLFGTLDLDIDKLFDEADADGDGCLSFPECLTMLQRAGAPMRQLLNTSVPGRIDGMTDYLSAVFAALDYRLRFFSDKVGDEKRTIGVYTDYVSTTDFDMAVEDRLYVLKQGWRAAAGYLRERAENKAT